MAKLRWYAAAATNAPTSTATRSGTGTITASGTAVGAGGVKLRWFNTNVSTPSVSVKLRFYNASAAGGSVTPKLRLMGVFASGAAPSAPKLRLLRIEGSGTATGTPKLRLYEVNVNGADPFGAKLQIFSIVAGGTTSPVLNPMAPITIEPLVMTSVSVTLASGTASSYQWRLVNGYPVTLINATTATVSFISPPQAPPAPRDVILGVVAVQGSATSSEEQIIITVLPQLDWTWDGTQWQGSVVSKIR